MNLEILSKIDRSLTEQNEVAIVPNISKVSIQNIKANVELDSVFVLMTLMILKIVLFIYNILTHAFKFISTFL